MKKQALFLCWLFLLVSCSQVATQQTSTPVMPTLTREITNIASPTPSKTPEAPTKTPQPSETPYPTPKPYLIKLMDGAGDGVENTYICSLAYAPYPKFILYEDGLLIFYEDGAFNETHLTSDEIKLLLERIEKTGYFEVGNSLKDHYNLPENIEYIGGGDWLISISVKGKRADIIPSLSQYLRKPISDTETIVRTYKPTGNVKTYIPVKVDLYATAIDMATLEAEKYPTPDPVNIKEWPTQLPRLDSYALRLSEIETNTFFENSYFTAVPSLQFFKQDGVTYSILACLSMNDWWY
jgi:hypothetical protein